MQRFKNGFVTKLTADMSASAYQISLDSAAANKLTFPDRDNDFYILTLSDSLDVTKQSAIEVVSVASGLFINRAQEGTSARSWPAGTFVYMSITAGWLEQVGGGGTDAGGGAGITYADMGTYFNDASFTVPNGGNLFETQIRGPLTVNFAKTEGMSAYEVLLIVENATDTAQTVTFNGPPDTMEPSVIVSPLMGTSSNGSDLAPKWAVPVPPGFNTFRVLRTFNRALILPQLAR